jgi:hypothetical protein
MDTGPVNAGTSGRLAAVLIIGLIGPVSLILAGPIAVLVGPVMGMLTLVLFVNALRQGIRGHSLLAAACVSVLIANVFVGCWIWMVLRD